MAMNHCGVLRNSSGAFERHECGYWCLSRPRAISAPTSASFVDDGRIRLAVLALVIIDLQSGEERHMREIARIFRHCMRHFGGAAIGEDRLVLEIGHIIIRAMAGRRMHEAGTSIVGDVIGGQDGDVEIPIAIGPVEAAERVGAALDHLRIHGSDALEALDARGLEDLLGQRIGDDVEIPGLRPVLLRRAGDFIEPVSDMRAIGDGAVGGDGPGGGGPDYDGCIGERRIIRGDDRELHPDRVRCLLMIFHLRLGQRGLFDSRPHHRLGAAIEAGRSGRIS